MRASRASPLTRVRWRAASAAVSTVSADEDSGRAPAAPTARLEARRRSLARLRASSIGTSAQSSQCESRLTISSSVRGSGLVDIGVSSTSSPTGSRQAVQRLGRGRASRQPRALAGERRRDEHEQLVDEVVARGTRPRASGRLRAGATARRRRPSAAARPRAARCGARAPSPPAAGRGRTRAAAAARAAPHVARASSARVVRPHRAHPDRDRVRPRPQLVHAAAARLAGDPARAGHGHAPVERHRDLVGHERPAARDPDAPGLVLRHAPPRVGDLDLDARRAEPLEAAPARPSGSDRRPPPRRARRPPSTTASAHGGVVPWCEHGSSET